MSFAISVTALAGARGLEEDTLREALLTLETKVSGDAQSVLLVSLLSGI